MSEQPEPAQIVLEGVEKTYRMGEVDVHVLRGIDLRIPAGQFAVILGVSGSGKTTLMNMIGGIDRPSAGKVLFRGQDITRFSDRQLTAYRRDHVGVVFQFFNLVPTLTARENVRVCTELVADPLSAEEALDRVGLSDRLDYFPAQMSGGEQQRVAIARALAKRPSLLLCDEPTGSLDFETGKTVLDLLTGLNEDLGATILIITHAAPIAQLAERLLRLRSGALVEDRLNDQRRTAAEISW